MNLGKRNQLGRFVLTRYEWHKREKQLYDRNGEPPRGYNVDPETLVVPLNFINLEWGQAMWPQGTARANYWVRKLVEHRLPGLIICDVIPFQSIRHPHARFVLPWEIIGKGFGQNGNFGRVVLEQGIIDHYYTSESELVDVLLSGLDGTLRTSLGTVVENCNYSIPLGKILQGGVLGWADIKESEAGVGEHRGAHNDDDHDHDDDDHDDDDHDDDDHDDDDEEDYTTTDTGTEDDDDNNDDE
ncbi:MAG: hypothetical protein LQ349_000111 [Xanthoria aureola]|nr:MAG: hypothetical protein LQ349_000111 [Xanthoria aureola]